MKMMTMRLSIIFATVAFAITLAVIVGQRMSSEAMAVLIGVVAGVAASIPTSLIVVWLATRSMVRDTVAPRAAEPETPRIVVMQPPPQPAPAYPYAPAQNASWPRNMPYPAVPAPRKFTVIGGVGEMEEVPATQLWETD